VSYYSLSMTARTVISTLSLHDALPILVNAQVESSSSAGLEIQSTPDTLTHRSVVGPGGVTPQRSTAMLGSPHAFVPCDDVRRACSPAISSGRVSMMSAHAGFAAAWAGSTITVRAQPARPTPASTAAMATTGRARWRGRARRRVEARRDLIRLP